MFEDRDLKLDLAALALLAVVVFLGLALATYDPADPPGTQVYPAQQEVQNACGRLGALSAHGLLQLLGLGAYYLVASLAVVDLLLLMRREIDQPLRALGHGRYIEREALAVTQLPEIGQEMQ